MPLFKLKIVWEYCSYNMPFFAFILILIFALNTIRDLSMDYLYSESLTTVLIGSVFVGIITIFLMGYGISITRDRINHGYRLPKIMLGDVFLLGIKSVFVYGIYFVMQLIILKYTSKIFDFPIFDLEELLLNFQDTAHMFFVNDPLYMLKFLLIGGIVFYITTFFVEIGLARLADTKSLLSAFNLVALYKCIKLVGFRRYILECTSIIVAIIILTYLKSFELPEFWIDQLWSTLLGFLIFATQYMGMGAVYANIKDRELRLRQSENDS